MSYDVTATTVAVTAGPEVIIVGVIILLVFGSAWLPKLARNAGRTKVELEKAKGEFEKAKADITEPFTETKNVIADAKSSLDPTKPAVTRTPAPKAPAAETPAPGTTPDTPAS